MHIKEQLFKHCQDFVDKRLQTFEEIISSNQKALQAETKSSAGDKHETGRAMLQLEMEKASQQLVGIQIMKQTLFKIDTKKVTSKAHLGSLVTTTSGVYFLSVSAGKIVIEDTVYYAVSVVSPIGKLLLGKQENDEYFFNNKKNKVILVK
jgi:transcription elongation GreA/GreB family factor